MAEIIKNLPSSEYHNPERGYSSSQLKDILEDEEVFYKKYISKEIERASIPAFDVGTFLHTSVLEPEKLEEECAVYKGVRRGEKWETFKKENANKVIITDSEYLEVSGMVKAINDSPVSKGRLSRGEAEVSCFAEVYVYGSEVFSSKGKLTLDGWDKTSKIPKKSLELKLKVRADLLGSDFILDVKSTRGNCKSENAVKKKIGDYHYDLSASLYLDVFQLAGAKVEDFIWLFASKDLHVARCWKASADNLKVGRAKWRRAVVNLADAIERDWKFEDSMGLLEPMPWDLEYIKPRGEDLL